MGNAKKFMLGSNQYRQESVHNDLADAFEKVRKMLQEEENRKHGRKAETVPRVYATKYIYDQFVKGRRI